MMLQNPRRPACTAPLGTRPLALPRTTTIQVTIAGYLIKKARLPYHEYIPDLPVVHQYLLLSIPYP